MTSHTAMSAVTTLKSHTPADDVSNQKGEIKPRHEGLATKSVISVLILRFWPPVSFDRMIMLALCVGIFMKTEEKKKVLSDMCGQGLSV